MHAYNFRKTLLFCHFQLSSQERYLIPKTFGNISKYVEQLRKQNAKIGRPWQVATLCRTAVRRWTGTERVSQPLSLEALLHFDNDASKINPTA